MTTIDYRAPSATRVGLVRSLREATDLEVVGGKALNLARMMKLGLRVPDGFVLTAAALERHIVDSGLRDVPLEKMREAVMGAPMALDVSDALRDAAGDLLRSGPVVVRSSAIGEDSATDSFAGQLDSFLHITDEAQLIRAVLACWSSCWSDRSLAYRASRGRRAQGMGVIVQQQVDARFGGVMFTRTTDDLILVEFTTGLADRLVAGEIDPSRIAMRTDGTAARPLFNATGTPALPESLSVELAQIAGALERGFGSPQDVEWVADDHGVQVVQTRPITAAVRALAAAEPHRTTRWTNANVSENFPEPITPLLYSIVSAGYAHYFRNLAQAFGLSRSRIAAMDDALRHVVGVHSARLYYNLTSIHTILATAPFGDRLVSAFNRFVGTDGAEGAAVLARPAGLRARLGEWRELAWIALKTSWTYFTIERRIFGFERTVDDFAARTHPSRLQAMDLRELRLALAELMDIRCNRWTSASLADAAAMVTYSALHRLIRAVYHGKEPGSLHNSLLKAIPGLVSGEPVHRLWELSRLLRENRTDEFQRAFDDYLERWGFRCSAELMLTIPSYQEDPTALMETIRSYAALDGESPAEALARQLAIREADTRAMLKIAGWRAPLILVVLRWTQASIALRERARLKQALLYSRCRRIALALGDRLVQAGRFARQDDVFWLTTSELDDLAAGATMFPAHVASLIAQRRDEHARLSATPAPDSFRTIEGDYEPLADDASAPIDEKAAKGVYRGTGACGGRVTGRVAVLNDVSEAPRLRQGDVLVTRQTDPGWAPVFFLISGLVIERGGMLSHGAIVAREFGIPCVVGIRDATSSLATVQRVSVDGDRGEVHVLD